jgi:hypothetical protein
MAKDAESVLNAGVVALLVKHAAAYLRERAARGYLEQAKAVIKEQEKVQRDALNALRLFGIDVDADDTWDRLVEKHQEEVWALLREDHKTLAPFDFSPDRVFKKQLADAALEKPKDELLVSIDTQATEALPRPQIPKIQDILLMRLQDAGESGSKAAPLRQYIEDTYNIEIHEKTVGMTLYRLLRKGLVRRQGHVWFFVSQETEDTKKPGEPPPGLVDLFK